MKKIIRIKGGLGNQMFQYAHGRKLSTIDKQKVIFDISNLQKQSPKDTPRSFVLNNFILDPKIEFKKLKQSNFSKILSKIISKITGNYHYYQSADYFKGIENILPQELTLKNPLSPEGQKFADQIATTENPVSIHIRRGDYVSDQKTNQYHSTCNIEYYDHAIKLIKEKTKSPTFFIFSDDINWVKENLKTDDAVFVSNPQVPDYEELILMSQCKHNIIANSSFSWWGAWLNQNPNKIVIAPKNWLKCGDGPHKNIVPESWIRI